MDVHRIAKLARLKLDDAEAASLKKELEAILTYAEDIAQVGEAASVSDAQAPLRMDEPVPGLSAKAIAQNAPQMEGTAFRVPKVIE